MNTPTLEPGQAVYDASRNFLIKTPYEDLVLEAWDELPQIARDAWAAGEAAVTTPPPTVASMDVEGAVQLLMDTCHDAAKSWWIDTETGEDVRSWPKKFFKLWVSSKLMLCVCELAEAMEGHRKDVQDDKLPNHKMITVEGADTLIRVCDLFGGLGLPMARAVVEKLAFNAVRSDHKIENRVAAGGKSI